MRDAAVPSRPLDAGVIIGFGTALAILVAIGADSYRSAIGLAENSRWVAHTHQVLSTLSALYADVLYVTSSRRGYVLTGDEGQAERARTAARSSRSHLAELRGLTADNPRQQARLDQLQLLVSQRLAEVEKSIDLQRRHPEEREKQAAATLKGTRTNDEIRGALGAMFDEERALLAERATDVQASLRRTKWVIVLGSTTAGLLLAVASFLFYREFRQRERAEADLRRSEALYRAVLSQFPNGAVLLFDGDLRYRLAEGQGLGDVGLSKSGLEGRTIWEALPPETCAAIEPAYRAALAGQPTTFEVPFGGRHFSVHVSPLAIAGGSRLGMVVTLDITERKRAEDDVRRLNAALSQKVVEATSAMGELEAFSYSVSHDLRAPIRHISGFVDMLQRRVGANLDGTAQRHLDTIARASRHMGQLIDDLLAFSRMSRGELMQARVSLGPLAREVIEGLRAEMDGRSIEWKVEELPDVRGDRAMLRIVLTNLLGNAVKYTRPRTSALIEIGQSAGRPGEVVLFVKDNGVGFEMQYADKLFGVFQRLHRSEEFEGTGIGLATVRRIVHRHGGRTWAEASVDAGATFYVALPRGPETS
jgi:PAS domain S-box-containing protein